MAKKDGPTRKAGAGRPKESAEMKAKRAELARSLIELIEKNSGLTAAEIEDALEAGTPGAFKGRTGRTWLRWKSGERALHKGRRSQVISAAIRLGWIKPIKISNYEDVIGVPANGFVCVSFEYQPNIDNSKSTRKTEDWPASYFQKIKRDKKKFEQARNGAIHHLKELHDFYLTTKPESFLPDVSTYGQGWKELEATIKKLEALGIDHHEKYLKI